VFVSLAVAAICPLKKFPSSGPLQKVAHQIILAIEYWIPISPLDPLVVPILGVEWAHLIILTI